MKSFNIYVVAESGSPFTGSTCVDIVLKLGVPTVFFTRLTLHTVPTAWRICHQQRPS
ncbi:hypothetical protein DPMN_034538 [Dreissena polymorpha]|uniref:Uncharacterized protein n=1 Tax=Dreissena polymorpha TaxID=45954 RepID=A0A9D4M5W7_DREPO|nr:hypothetical protein DPMN_034538 [Dreissena polymorpha]